MRELRTRSPLSLVLCAALAAGCGDGDASQRGASDAATSSSDERRDDRPDAVRARDLIDRGRADLARPLVEELADGLGVEGALLLARIEVLEGDTGDWLALVETARASDPRDPRPYATAAELYAAIGRVDAAKDELQRGIEAVGSVTPELQRAQGVLAIVTPGGGRIGLELLETAERADPGLPFLGRPLGQAHLLAAKRAMAERRGEMALERVEASLKYDPDDPDARRFYGEVLIGVARDYDRGLAVLENLLAEGEPVTDVLGRMAWSAGLAAQLERDSEAALRHYLRARELGAIEVEKGTARSFLRAQADASFERGVAAAAEGDEGALRRHVREAVELTGTDADGGTGVARSKYAELLAARAQDALRGGEHDLATRLLDLATELEPRVRSIAVVRGAMLFARAVDAMEAGDADLAVDLAKQATEANPDDTVTLHFLGELRYARGEYAEAAPVLDRALRNARLDGEPLGIDVKLMLAECQHLSGSVDDAVATLEQCLRSTRPEDAAGRERAARYLALLESGDGR